MLWMLVGGHAWAAEKIIGTIDVVGTRFVTPENITQVLPFKSGDPFREELLTRARDTLKQWGRFSAVDVKSYPESQDKIRIVIGVSEARLISSIDMTGTYPFLARRLKRMLTLRQGMIFQPETLDVEKERLIKFYAAAGFTETHIDVSVQGKEGSPWVIPQFHINRGRRLRIGDIHVAGNHVLQDRTLKNKINTFLLYSPRRLKANLAAIKETYANRGYLAARVHLKEIRLETPAALKPRLTKLVTRRGPVMQGRVIDTSHRRVNIWIDISEGKKVRVAIKGAEHLPKKKIRAVMTVLKEGYWDPHEMKVTSEAVTKLYREEGYLAAEVTLHKVSEDAALVALALDIKEGPRSAISKIEIDGNHGLSDSKIKAEMETKRDSLFTSGIPDAKILENDLGRIGNLYRREGFPDVQVGTPEESENANHYHTIKIPVQEGERVRISSVEFLGLKTLLEKKARKILKWGQGKPYNPIGIDTDKEKLLVELASHGQPHAQAKAQIRREGNQVALIYDIDEGTAVQNGKILVVGNQSTRESAILKSISVKPGTPFSYKKMLESQAGLRRISAFNSASLETIGLNEMDSVVHPLIHVEENPPYVFNTKASYSTDTNFTGVVTLTDRNFLNRAKQANLQLTGGNDLERAEANLINSRLFGLAVQGIVNGFGEFQRRASFNYFRYGSAVSFLHDFTPTLTGLAKYEIARTQVTSSIPGADPNTELAQSLTAPKATLSLSYDTRDSFADPHRGLHTLVNTEFFNKIFGAGANFVRVSTGASHYFSLGHRWTLTNSVRVAGIQRYFTIETVPGQEKLYLGGDYTVRGFGQDALLPTGGEVSVLATSELHTRLFDNFKFVLFTDTGSITNAFRAINAESLRHSAGAGIHYVTPIGPIRLDWAFKLDRKSGEDLYRIHFIFGYAF